MREPLGPGGRSPTSVRQKMFHGQAPYRPDVDGLRAVAVIAVILYHAGFPAVTGGFIGVDIFFVISGFIIARALLAEIQKGRFSIRHFYLRRFRRIYPPLLTVLLATLVTGYFLLTPEELEGAAESGLAAMLLVPNLFFSDANYFAAGEVRPLLHTWSLGVEEQVYLVFPLLLVPFAKHLWGRTATFILIVTLGILSFGASLLAIASDMGDEAFFFPHLRAWELLAGGALAFIPEHFRPAVWIRKSVPILGLSLLTYLALSYDASTLFPGPGALLPVIGAMAVIAFQPLPNTVASALLQNPISVFIGRISYSLYLWHYPVFVFLTYLALGELTIGQKFAAMGATFVLSVASWKLVEQRFRRKPIDGRRAPSLSLLMMGGAIVTVISLLIVQLDGLPHRFSEAELRYIAMQEKELYFAMYDRGGCFLDYDQTAGDYNVESCESDNLHNRVLLWGDSYAAHLYPGLQEILGSGVYQYTATSCRPIATGGKRCEDFVDRFAEVLSRTKPQTVVLSGSWSSRFTRLGSEAFSARLRESVQLASSAGARVIVTGNSPTYQIPLPHLARLRPEMRAAGTVYFDSTDHEKLNQTIQEVAKSEGVHYFDFFSHCRALTCPAFIDGEPLHWDSGHMTREGSLFYGEKLSQLLSPGI